MVKDAKYLESFEHKFIQEHPLSYEQSLKLFEEMWKEAVALGILPPKNSMEGIEVDMRIVKIIGTCLKRS